MDFILFARVKYFQTMNSEHYTSIIVHFDVLYFIKVKHQYT